MIALTVRVTDGASPVLQRLSQALGRPRPITEAVAQATVVELQKHFLARNREPNKRGWTKQNFWTKEGREKTAIADLQDSRAVVAVGSPAIAHKLTGGTIRPKRGKYLAIPLTAEAYKAGSPREGGIDGLEFAVRSGYGPCLIRPGAMKATRTRVKQSGRFRGEDSTTSVLSTSYGADVVHYLLVRSVTHAPDPRTLPEPQTLATAAEKAARTALRVLLAQASGPSAQS